LYIFGDGANVNNKSLNDPTNPQLVLENVENFPIYIRFAPEGGDDRWKLQRATVTFNGQLFPMWDTLDLFPDGIWLASRAGLVLFIPKHQDQIPG
jgi:hypothetical protein